MKGTDDKPTSYNAVLFGTVMGKNGARSCGSI